MKLNFGKLLKSAVKLAAPVIVAALATKAQDKLGKAAGDVLKKASKR